MKLNQYLIEDRIDEAKEKASQVEQAIVDVWNNNTPKYDDLVQIGANIAESLIKEHGFIPGGGAKRIGGGSGASDSVTKEWKKYGGSNKTPKTDLTVNGVRISLKQSGGSQLMSGAKEETRATFHAAISKLHMDGSPVINRIEEFLQGFIKEKSDQTVTQAREGGKIKPLILTTDMVHKEFQDYLRKYFETDQTFKQAVIHEAMSGLVKFGDKSKSRATHLLKFQAGSGLDNEFLRIDDANTVSMLSQKTKVGIRFKSTGKTIHNIYSTMRLDINDELQRLVDEHEYLTEGIIGDIGKKIKNFFRKVWNKIKVWLAKSMNNVLEFLGFEPVMTPIKIKF